MKLKSVFLSLVLALTGAVASAGVVHYGPVAVNDSFDKTLSFHLDSAGLFTGLIKTESMLMGNATITSFSLFHGTETLAKYAFGSGLSAFASLTNISSPILVDMGDGTFEDFGDVMWTQTYLTTPMWLQGGDWTLVLAGTVEDNKDGATLEIALDRSEVPEPQSLALAFGALAALGLVRRRRQSAAQ